MDLGNYKGKDGQAHKHRCGANHCHGPSVAVRYVIDAKHSMPPPDWDFPVELKPLSASLNYMCLHGNKNN
jgi:hypothetical protein